MPLVVLDWKSGFVAPEARLQLAAYSTCPSLASKPDQAMIVQVNQRHCKPMVKMGPEEILSAFRAFQAAKSLFDWMVDQDIATIPKNEVYKLDGVFLPSVTWVLRHTLAKPQLLGWYAKMAREGKDPDAIKNERAEQGKTIHHAIHTILSGNKVDLQGAPDWLAKPIGHFLSWKESVELEPVRCEFPVFNKELSYAGTLDCLARIKEPVNKDAQLQQELAEFMDKED